MNPHRSDNCNAMRQWFVAVVLVALAGGMANAQDDWTRHFRLGAVVGLGMKADFKMNGQFNVSGSGQPGMYDDGYVLVDETGNAGGYTSYWGYDKPSQYNAADHTLTFHSASSFNLTDNTHVDNGAQVGLDLVYGGNLMKSGDALFGWEFGFMWMPMLLKDNRELSTTFTRNAYVFQTGDIVVPNAPYNGGPSGIGPTIQDVASPGIAETSPGTITGTRELDVTLYNFRLGPSLHWELSRYFAFSISGGAAVGITPSEYKFNEMIQTTGGGGTPNRGSFDQTDVMFGWYGGATLIVHTAEKADIFVGAQFMALDKAQVSSQGREASVDLGGQVYLSAGINWPF